MEALGSAAIAVGAVAMGIGAAFLSDRKTSDTVEELKDVEIAARNAGKEVKTSGDALTFGAFNATANIRRADGYLIRAQFAGKYLNNSPIRYISGSILFDAFTDSKDDLPLTVISSPLLPLAGNLYGEEGDGHNRRLFQRGVAAFDWKIGRALSLGDYVHDSVL